MEMAKMQYIPMLVKDAKALLVVPIWTIFNRIVNDKNYLDNLRWLSSQKKVI